MVYGNSKVHKLRLYPEKSFNTYYNIFKFLKQQKLLNDGYINFQNDNTTRKKIMKICVDKFMSQNVYWMHMIHDSFEALPLKVNVGSTLNSWFHIKTG